MLHHHQQSSQAPGFRRLRIETVAVQGNLSWHLLVSYLCQLLAVLQWAPLLLGVVRSAGHLDPVHLQLWALCGLVQAVLAGHLWTDPVSAPQSYGVLVGSVEVLGQSVHVDAQRRLQI